jgi:peptide/nickel transport system permease protein
MAEGGDPLPMKSGRGAVRQFIPALLAARGAPAAALYSAAAPRSYWSMVWRRFRRHRLAMAGAAVALALSAVSLLAPWVAPYEFRAIDLANLFSPPSRAHLLGTDELGHDIFTRIVYAGRVSLTVGFVATFISTVIGATMGLLGGFHGGLVDNVLMRVTDVFLSIPSIAVMFVLAKFLGPGLQSIIIVLCAFGWTSSARLVRAEVLRVRTQEFFEAARAIGASDNRLLVRHCLPNALAPVTVAATLFVGQAILSESTISYFGLGIQPPVPSWGNMLQNAQEYLWTAPWLAIYPGVFIFATVLAFNLLGDGLRDALDPRLKV